MIFWNKFSFLFFVRVLELKINNKKVCFKNIIIGINSYVFDYKKSNKSNLEVIRPSFVALLPL